MKRLIIASAALAMAFAVSAQAQQPPAKYNMYCIACHGTGAAGAPKAGDKAAWAPRLEKAKGVDGLVAVAKKGLNAMPPMGLCNECTDAELKEVIEYMSGSK